MALDPEMEDPLKDEKQAYKKEVGEMREDMSFAEKYALQTINEQIIEKNELLKVAKESNKEKIIEETNAELATLKKLQSDIIKGELKLDTSQTKSQEIESTLLNMMAIGTTDLSKSLLD